MGGSGGGRDLDFGIVTWKIPLWAETKSRHELDVATQVSLQEGRDLVLVSRPGSGLGRRNDVATWVVLVGRKGGPDMGLTSRPGMLNLGSRPHFEVAT